MFCNSRAFGAVGALNPGERHSRDTRKDSTVTLCTLRAATVLSRDCRADFGRPLTKKVMSHSRDGPGVTAPSRTNIVPLTGVWNPPPFRTPPLKKSLNSVHFTKTTGITKITIMTETTQTAASKGIDCWICGNHGKHGNDENHENAGCKSWVHQNLGRKTRL